MIFNAAPPFDLAGNPGAGALDRTPGSGFPQLAQKLPVPDAAPQFGQKFAISSSWSSGGQV
jgi:hypothetical protein